jgi:hypothetical protein
LLASPSPDPQRIRPASEEVGIGDRAKHAQVRTENPSSLGG